MKKYLPVGLSKPLSYEQILARTGFLFIADQDCLDFKVETPLNRQFLNELFAILGLPPLKGGRFAIQTGRINQAHWIDAWYAWHPGEVKIGAALRRQGEFELPGIDPYVAGISRWLTVSGCTPVGSCDGHGKYKTRIHLKHHSQAPEVAEMIERCSAKRVTFVNPYLRRTHGLTRDQFYCDLLDLAENMYLEIRHCIPPVAERNFAQREEEGSNDSPRH